ncbi:DUF4142 domain-containing protein [Paracidovorax citrulli]
MSSATAPRHPALRAAAVWLLAGLPLFWQAGPVQAQRAPGVSPPVTDASRPPAASLSTDDLRFIDEAVLTSAMGIETAGMVLEVSADPTLTAYARKVAEDHQEMAAELAQIASDKGVQPEKRLPEAPEVSRLRTLKGPDFDRMYVQMVAVDANRQAVALFERQAEIGKDPALRAFAKRSLEKLKRHLSMGQSMATRTVTWRSGIAHYQERSRPPTTDAFPVIAPAVPQWSQLVNHERLSRQ